MPQNASLFFINSRSSGQKKDKKEDFFSTLHPLSTVIFATATVLAFVLLRNSRFNFHCYTQREATPTQKSARKCAATSRDFLRERLQNRIHSSKPASLNRPIYPRQPRSLLACDAMLTWVAYRKGAAFKCCKGNRFTGC